MFYFFLIYRYIRIQNSCIETRTLKYTGEFSTFVKRPSDRPGYSFSSPMDDFGMIVPFIAGNLSTVKTDCSVRSNNESNSGEFGLCFDIESAEFDTAALSKHGDQIRKINLQIQCLLLGQSWTELI